MSLCLPWKLVNKLQQLVALRPQTLCTQLKVRLHGPVQSCADRIVLFFNHHVRQAVHNTDEQLPGQC
jgi:hypothetical protein